MEDPGVGLSFTYEVPRSVQHLLSTDRENTKGNESPLEIFHTPRTQPIVPVVSTKRKRAMGASNDRSIRRKLILRVRRGNEFGRILGDPELSREPSSVTHSDRTST